MNRNSRCKSSFPVRDCDYDKETNKNGIDDILIAIHWTIKWNSLTNTFAFVPMEIVKDDSDSIRAEYPHPYRWVDTHISDMPNTIKYRCLEVFEDVLNTSNKDASKPLSNKYTLVIGEAFTDKKIGQLLKEISNDIEFADDHCTDEDDVFSYWRVQGYLDYLLKSRPNDVGIENPFDY